MTEHAAVPAALSPQQLEQLWAEHLKGEFETKDVEATLETMVEDAYVNHMPVNTGGRGKEELRVFFRNDFIPSWPEDLQITPINRVVGAGQLVDELHVTFTHNKPMHWFLPNIPPTHKKITDKSRHPVNEETGRNHAGAPAIVIVHNGRDHRVGREDACDGKKTNRKTAKGGRLLDELYELPWAHAPSA